MSLKKTICVFGATGKVGNHVVDQALEAGYKVRVFVRDQSKPENPDKVEICQGRVESEEDVSNAISGADVVVSCLGNPDKKTHIMYTAHNNIMNMAAKQDVRPKCIMISSVGCGGTSWLIKQMLILIGGKASYIDYERADMRVRGEDLVHFVLVRPYGLTDKAGKGKYYATMVQNGTFLRPIARQDVAKFMIDAIEDRQWEGQPGVLLGGAK